MKKNSDSFTKNLKKWEKELNVKLGYKTDQSFIVVCRQYADSEGKKQAL